MNRTSDYIRRDKAINTIAGITTSMSVCLSIDECHGMKKTQQQAVMEIANMLPEDVQPVVRCKECEHWDEEYGTCYCDDFEIHSQDYYVGDMHTESDFFCGFGKRKG